MRKLKKYLTFWSTGVLGLYSGFVVAMKSFDIMNWSSQGGATFCVFYLVWTGACLFMYIEDRNYYE